MSTSQKYFDLVRPMPSKPRMPRQNRAKIFAPYQAFKGFSEAVHEKDTVYVRRLELSEYVKECLDRKLRQLRRWDTVSVTWFRPKPGGEDPDTGQYITVTGTVKHIDPVIHLLLLGEQKIPMDDIADLWGERLDGISEWELTREIPTSEETVCGISCRVQIGRYDASQNDHFG